MMMNVRNFRKEGIISAERITCLQCWWIISAISNLYKYVTLRMLYKVGVCLIYRILSLPNYLEIIIDSDLIFHHHIFLLEHKTSKTVGLLSKLRHFLPHNALLSMFSFIINSHTV